MIDFHSHILPAIDDGSSSVQESLAMIGALSRQGVDTIVSTSHFYATRRSPQEFLQRRQEAYEKVRAELPEGSPRILLGAEVLYFPGISRMEDLPSLCTQGTNILLLEMPFTAWSEHMIREVHDLAHSGCYQLLMAHIERYFFQQPLSIWDEFLEEGILMQSNADFLLNWRTRRKALRLWREGRIHLLGTDCHNMDSRAPRMDEAVRTLRKHLGEESLDEMVSLGYDTLRSVL